MTRENESDCKLRDQVRKNSVRSIPHYELLVFIVIALWFEWPVLFHPLSRIVGGIPDAFQYTWYLGWFWHAVTHGLSPFYSHNINFPNGIGFMYNTSVIAPSALFGWLVYLTNGVFVYNFVFFLNIVLIGVLGRLLLLELGVGRLLALWGAVMFCTMPYLTAQGMGHLSQYFLSPIFALLYLFVRVIKRGTNRPILYAVSLGVFVAIEFYTSIELIVTGALGIAIFLAYLLLQKRGRQVFQKWIGSIRLRFWIAFVSAATILALPGVVEFAMTGGLSLAGKELHAGSGLIWGADILSPIIPVHVLLMHIHLTDNVASHFTGDTEELGNYIGLFVLPLPIILRGVWKGPVARAVGWFTGTMFILSLGDKLHIGGHITSIVLPWELFSHIPFLKSALPMRLAVYVDIGLVIWLAVSFQQYFSQLKSNGRKSLGWTRVTLVLCVLSWFPTLHYPSAQSYSLPSAVINKIGSQPVYWLSTDFGADMQPMAASGYRVSAYNSYGFTPHLSIGKDATPPISFYYYFAYDHSRSVESWSKQLQGIKKKLPGGFILLTPFNPTPVSIPKNLKTAIKKTLGNPSFTSDGCELWEVGHS